MAGTAKKNPRKKSAIKASKRSVKLRSRNEDFKIRMKKAMKTFSKNPEAKDIPNLYKVIDKCAKVGVISKQSAGRKKALVVRKLSTGAQVIEKKTTKPGKKTIKK